jgi:hypothetical protein
LTDELFPACEREDDRHELNVACGVPLDEATSSLQKCIRRGLTVEATFWATQIADRYPWHALRRLGVIACEDVGSLEAVQTVNACREAYVFHTLGAERKKNGGSRGRPDPVLLVHAVRVLCESPKDRSADDLKCVVQNLVDEGWRPPVRPEALDRHTARGRELLDEDEGWRHWFEHGSVVDNEVGFLDWKLAHRRWAVRRGVLDAEQVEAEAREWDAQGRLRYGVDGWAD